MRTVALDTNLMLLAVVGRADPNFVAKHKRLRDFLRGDFELLVDILQAANRIVSTPNSLTEASNISSFGVAEPMRTRISVSLRLIIEQLDEIFQPSRDAANEPEYARLGLADTAWLGALRNDVTLVTIDGDLHRAAISRGFQAVHFAHLRAERKAK